MRRWQRRWRRIWRGLRAFQSEQVELTERLMLLNRPWEEEYLHWSFDGAGWHLHGQLSPPDNVRRYSVTSTGWCPALHG